MTVRDQCRLAMDELVERVFAKDRRRTAFHGQRKNGTEGRKEREGHRGARIESLGEIWLLSAKVTAEGVKDFRKARPQCGVAWEPSEVPAASEKK